MRYLPICAIVGLVWSNPVHAQDLSFLPLVLDRAVTDADENMGRRHGAVFVDVGSVVAASAGAIAGPAARATVIGALVGERDRPFVPVDSVEQVIERGPPTSPAYQQIAARYAGAAPLVDKQGMVRWIRNDGVYLRVRSIRATPTGFEVLVFPSSTYPFFLGMHGRPTIYRVERLPNDGWALASGGIN